MQEETFWDRFVRLRASLPDSPTEVEFDRRYGVSRDSQKNWKHKGTIPEVATLARLAEIFGVTIDYLYSGTIRTDADRSAAQALAKTLAAGPPPLPRVRRRRGSRGAQGKT